MASWILGLCLLLVVYGEELSAADFYIWDLPGLDKSTTKFPTMHSGNILIKPEQDGSLFFWHVEGEYTVDTPKTVIWLNGGPGCSSMDGALMEIGPYRLKDEKTLMDNPGSWNRYADLLFIDQPVGVGFSTIHDGGYLHDLPEMARDMLTFLDKYFELFPEQLDRELYIAGESFAGQYIPYITKAILDRNKELSLHDKQYLNLQGLLIGNGWIDPVNQYLTYLQFSYSTGLIEQGSKAANVIEQMHNACADALSELANMTVHVDKCEKMTNEIFSQWHQNTRLNVNDPKSCVNMYNINLTDTYPSCGMNWPPDLEYMYPYLQSPEVRSALHTAKDSSAWEECRGKPGKEFNTEHSVASVSLLPELLDQIPIWFFNGDQDFICNHLGNERMIDQLEWNGYKGFNEIDEVEEAWIYDGTMAGTVTSGRNLTYVKFFEASHMVPFDFPERTQFMLNVFTGLTDWKLNNRVAKPDPGLQHEGEDEDRDKLINDAKWHAYYRAGEVALVFVVIATIGFGYFLYRNNVEILSDGNETHSWLRSFVRGLSRWKPNSHLTQNRYRYSGLSNSSPLTGRRTFTDAEVILEASEEGEDEDDNRRPQDEENGYHDNESTNRELEEFVVHKP